VDTAGSQIDGSGARSPARVACRYTGVIQRLYATNLNASRSS
jgi:hypothetical protein